VLASSLPLRTLSRLGDWVAEERTLPGPPWPLNAILLAILAVSPLPLAALALNEVTALFWLVLVADLVLLFVVAVATFRTPALFIAVMVLWFALQRLVVALIAPHVSADQYAAPVDLQRGFYLILLTASAEGRRAFAFAIERACPRCSPPMASRYVWPVGACLINDPQSSSELTPAAIPALSCSTGGRRSSRGATSFSMPPPLVAVAVGVALFGLIEPSSSTSPSGGIP
jgi:hypothetical protein